MKLSSSPQWRTKGGAVSILAPWIGMSLFDDERENENELQAKMSFLDHLEELRRRLILSLVGLGVGLAICWSFSEQIYDFLAVPITQFMGGEKLKYLTPTEPFNVYMQVALLAGVFVASPVVLWQVWLFISPGLYKRERRFALPFIGSSTLLFVLGGAFSYKVALPMTLHFLRNYGHKFESGVTVTAYLDFAVMMILGCAILFEIPILIFFLSIFGIVNAKFLFRNLRYAILVIFIVAAVITPTPDILTMMVFALPMLLLYLLGIVVAWVFGKKQRAAER
jgi:sec-independent protein translocase protein TatC